MHAKSTNLANSSGRKSPFRTNVWGAQESDLRPTTAPALANRRRGAHVIPPIGKIRNRNLNDAIEDEALVYANPYNLRLHVCLILLTVYTHSAISISSAPAP